MCFPSDKNEWDQTTLTSKPQYFDWKIQGPDMSGLIRWFLWICKILSNMIIISEFGVVLGGFNKNRIFFRKLEKTEFSIEMWQPERLEFLHILPKLLVWGWLERSQRICIWPIWAPWYLLDLRYVSWNLLGVCHMWYMLFAWWSTSTVSTCVYTCCSAYSPRMVRTYAVPTWTDKHVLDRQPTLGFAPYGNFKLGMLMSGSPY